MRTYLDQKIKKKENELTAVTCNCCKKELLVENGILKEECVSFSHLFGYFSERDGEKHRFDLCVIRGMGCGHLQSGAVICLKG